MQLSAVQQALRQPMIKFLGPRLPRPSFQRDSLPPLPTGNVGSAPSVTATRASSIGPVGNTPRGTGIDPLHLPGKLQRRDISAEEIASINPNISLRSKMNAQLWKWSAFRDASIPLDATPPPLQTCTDMNDGAEDDESMDTAASTSRSNSTLELQTACVELLEACDPSTTSKTPHRSRRRRASVAVADGVAEQQIVAAACRVRITLQRLARKAHLSVGAVFRADNMLARVFSLLQSNVNEEVTGVLCDLLTLYIGDGERKIYARRVASINSIDGTGILLKTLKKTLQAGHLGSSVRIVQLVAVVSKRDSQSRVKIRLSGCLLALAASVDSDPVGQLLPRPLFSLFMQSLNSGRNVELCLRRFPSIPTKLARLAFESPDEEFRLSVWHALYQCVRNKNSRTSLLAQIANLCSQLNAVQLHTLDGHRELLLLSLLLRTLSQTKRGRDELMACNVQRSLEMIADRMDSAEMNNNFAAVPTSVSSQLAQLQDSLLALWLRAAHLQSPPTSRQTPPFAFSWPTDLLRSPHKQRLYSGDSVDLDVTPSSDDQFEESSRAIEPDDMVVVDEDGEEMERTRMDTLEEEEASSLEREERNSSTAGKTAVEKEHPKRDMAELRHYTPFFRELFDGSRRMSLSTVRTALPPHSQRLPLHAQNTRSVVEFAKLARPQLDGPLFGSSALGYTPPDAPFATSQQTFPSMLRVVRTSASYLSQQQSPDPATIGTDQKSTQTESPTERRIVYDASGPTPTSSLSPSFVLRCDDSDRVGRPSLDIPHLMFESRFESGNLWRAVQVGPYHYELFLSPDINASRPHCTWFYFEVANMEANKEYTFEIANCLRPQSMFSEGMQPVVYSVAEANAGRPAWRRAGSNVSYTPNLYTSSDGTRKTRTLYSLRFTLSTAQPYDVLYVAYHYPYTFSYLQTVLDQLVSESASDAYIRVEELCKSEGGNSVPLVTITGAGAGASRLTGRPTVLLTARVHPGESNSSWVLDGALAFLMTSSSPIAMAARARFVWRIVPMLNPDGVINGSHRCGLAGHDLNRVWQRPSSVLHPTIFHTLGLLDALDSICRQRPFTVIDLHGHSRRSSCFLYGCDGRLSWKSTDRTATTTTRRESIDGPQHKQLPSIMSKRVAGFSLSGCQYTIQRVKEGSLRVAAWRRFAPNLTRVYTLETTYAGFEEGRLAGLQVTQQHLRDIGVGLVESILTLHTQYARFDESPSTHH